VTHREFQMLRDTQIERVLEWGEKTVDDLRPVGTVSISSAHEPRAFDHEH